MVLVNDGSTDDSLPIMRALVRADARVRVIDFSRNFGHQAAISAGLAKARGDAVIIMDADLQDPPEVLPDLIAAWRASGEVVYAQRTGRAGVPSTSCVPSSKLATISQRDATWVQR